MNVSCHEDYAQAALGGEFEAYEYFDPDRGVPFAAYALFYINRVLNRCTHKMIMVPMSVHDMENYYTVKHLVDEFEDESKCKSQDDELMALIAKAPSEAVRTLTLRQVKLLLQYFTDMEYIDGESQDTLAATAVKLKLLWLLPTVTEKMVACKMERRSKVDAGLHDRMCCCLTGLFWGMSLGAPFEFTTREEVQDLYPDGISDFEDGWNVTNNRRRGGISDDAEMSVGLLISLYLYDGFSSHRNSTSQGNRALARVVPTFIRCLPPGWDWSQAAEVDAKLPYVSPKCTAANIIFVESPILAMQGEEPRFIYEKVLERATKLEQAQLYAVLQQAEKQEPDYNDCPGCVQSAFQAAYYWLLQYKKFRSALLTIVNRPGSPNANASIADALLGAVLREKKIPKAWCKTIKDTSLRVPMFGVLMALKPLKQPPKKKCE